MFSAGKFNTRPHRSVLRLEELEQRALPAVYSPQQVWKAYDFNSLFSAGINGAGQTIAIVVAYDAPNIATDLHNFDVQWKLPDPVFVKATPQGQPQTDKGWSLEASLDVEWAHAVAPGANILLVEAKSASLADLMGAVSYAANQSVNGAPVTVVSMSWGLGEFSAETAAAYDGVFTHPGVTYVAASGDSGSPPIWPAVSKNVVSVGGTTLNLDSTGTYLSESGWGNGNRSRFLGGSGGGVSRYEPKPSYQSTVTQSSTRRTSPDVAYGANPSTGFYVLDSTNGGWWQVGGTSAGALEWAGLFALANDQRADNGLAPLSGASQALPALYNLPAADFHDIKTGNNGFPAGPGYDLVTGRGSPIASLVVHDLASTTFVPNAAVLGAPVNPGTPGAGRFATRSSAITISITNSLSGSTAAGDDGSTLRNAASHRSGDAVANRSGDAATTSGTAATTRAATPASLSAPSSDSSPTVVSAAQPASRFVNLSSGTNLIVANAAAHIGPGPYAGNFGSMQMTAPAGIHDADKSHGVSFQPPLTNDLAPARAANLATGASLVEPAMVRSSATPMWSGWVQAGELTAWWRDDVVRVGIEATWSLAAAASFLAGYGELNSRRAAPLALADARSNRAP